MDKSVLLVLLCLQAFLLITAFTSTDAGALVTDDQQQKSIDLEGTAEKEIGKLIRTRRSCFRRLGGCRVRINLIYFEFISVCLVIYSEASFYLKVINTEKRNTNWYNSLLLLT
ncbi:hypothetical protein PAMA_004845 [Pampus argenteus]